VAGHRDQSRRRPRPGHSDGRVPVSDSDSLAAQPMVRGGGRGEPVARNLDHSSHSSLTVTQFKRFQWAPAPLTEAAGGPRIARPGLPAGPAPSPSQCQCRGLAATVTVARQSPAVTVTPFRVRRRRPQPGLGAREALAVAAARLSRSRLRWTLGHCHGH
jgi:hypothetical protein